MSFADGFHAVGAPVTGSSAASRVRVTPATDAKLPPIRISPLGPPATSAFT